MLQRHPAPRGDMSALAAQAEKIRAALDAM